ncbi:MAG: hypothetical protein II598_03065 [Elusimicrobia bacterium]|nr:hypothetical protein [Elusimicrobiota bacterium]
MEEKMDVFKEVEEVDLGNGHKLEVHIANFIEGEKLFTEVADCYSKGIEGIALLNQEKVKLALIPCIKKSFFDKQPINDLSFFEKVNMRQYYVPICMSVLEINTKPFMISPSL